MHRSNIAPRNTHRKARRGFTLLEMIVVVVIIALLAAMVTPRLFDNIGRSRVRIATSGVASIYQQVHIYMSDHELSRLPNNFNLEALVPKYVREKDLLDPWGNPFAIIIPGEHNPDFDIVSYGADGAPGGDGEDADIVN